MKKLVPLLFLAVALLPIHADIVANGDFSDGTAHWHGDGAGSSDSNSDAQALLNAPSAGASAGIVVHLQPTKWTRIYQTISTREASLGYSVTYKTSADCVFSNDTSMGRPAISALTGTELKGAIPVPPGTMAIAIIDMMKGTLTSSPITAKVSTDPQTVTGTLPKFTGSEDKTLLLAFPPGDGTVTVMKVILTAAGDSPASP